MFHPAEHQPQAGQDSREDGQPGQPFGHPAGTDRRGEQAGHPAEQQARRADRDERGLVPQEQRHRRQVDHGHAGPRQRSAHPPRQPVAQQQRQPALGDPEGHGGHRGRVQVRDGGSVHADHAGRVSGPGDERGGRGGAAASIRAGPRRPRSAPDTAVVAGTAVADALLSCLRERSGSLAAPVLLHLAVNCAGPLASAVSSRLDAAGQPSARPCTAFNGEDMAYREDLGSPGVPDPPRRPDPPS